MLPFGTRGLKTTSSIWSSSHEGTSPAISPTPSALRRSASSGQSMSALRSFRATTAPRAARKRDAATPLRPAPKTRTFLPTRSISESQNEHGRTGEPGFEERWIGLLCLSKRPILSIHVSFKRLPSAQLQGRKAQEREQDGDDQEAEDDFGLHGPLPETLLPQNLEVVVQRRHLEDAPLRRLERRHLNHHRQSLDDEHAADDQQNQILLRQDAYR